MRVKVVPGVAIVAAELIGAGALTYWPEAGLAIMAAGGLLLPFVIKTEPPIRKADMWPVIGMVVGGVIFLGCLAWLFVNSSVTNAAILGSLKQETPAKTATPQEIAAKINSWSLARGYSLTQKTAPSDNGFEYAIAWQDIGAGISFHRTPTLDVVFFRLRVVLSEKHRQMYLALNEEEQDQLKRTITRALVGLGGEFIVDLPDGVVAQEYMLLDQFDNSSVFFSKIVSLQRATFVIRDRIVDRFGKDMQGAGRGE